MNPHASSFINRRTLLQRSAAGFGYLALQAMLGRPQVHAETAVVENPLAPKAPHFPARAKRIVFLFMKGGPSHVDTFDPKPPSATMEAFPFQPRVQFAQTGTSEVSVEFQQHDKAAAVSDGFPMCAVRG
jgi:hypothetical protein